MRLNSLIGKLKEKCGTKFGQIFKTITSDNGSEFSELTLAVKDVKTNIYYTHPYSSFERGTNERTNGLIREKAEKVV